MPADSLPRAQVRHRMEKENRAIVGGTGAYLGGGGQLRGLGGNPRAATMEEDPRKRRDNAQDDPDKRVYFGLHLIPMQAPEVITAPIGPLIFRHDFTLVASATPALPNRDIILFATGLGPTNPEVDLTQPFPPPPPPHFQSPLTVTVYRSSHSTLMQPVSPVGLTDAR